MRHAAHAGFSMIEALVAIVVVATGLIGVATLYSQALAAARAAQLRSQAIDLAAGLADLLRGNPAGGAAYAISEPMPGCTPKERSCPPPQRAAEDLLAIGRLAEERLPNGRIVIGYDDAVMPPELMLSVTWDETGAGVGRHRIVVRTAAL